MADEIQLQYEVQGTPEQVLAAWKATPPRALTEDKWPYELADEAYDALVFRSTYMDWPQKVTVVCTLGFALLFKGFMESSFEVTARFDADGPTRTKITLLGHAHPRTRAALGELAAENGGAVGLKVGV